MLNKIFNSLVDAIMENPDWWGTAIVLGIAQPIYANFTDSPMAVLGVSNSFISYLVPTILGCMLSVYKSAKPFKERWVIVVMSILFNGYILESLSFWLVGMYPNSAGYFLGGVIGFYAFDLLFTLLEQLRTKGSSLVWRYAKNKADAGASFVSDFSEELPFPEIEEEVIEKPKRITRKPKEEKR